VNQPTRDIYLAKIKSSEPMFELWAKHSPATYSHRLLLIKAGLARIMGDGLAAIDLYSEAIRTANASGFVEDQALDLGEHLKTGHSVNTSKAANGGAGSGQE
jgi:hypothetical protein